MSIIIKTKEEIGILREGGRRLAGILRKVKEMVRPGVSAKELDDCAFKLIKEAGDEPAFLGYRPEDSRVPYPASLCVSVNDEVVHGIPREDKVLKEGDIVSLDLGLKHGGKFTDMAVTVPVGAIDEKSAKLLEITEQALRAGIAAVSGGTKSATADFILFGQKDASGKIKKNVERRVGDISHAIESFVRPHGYGIVEVLSGHGVGRYIHEDPHVPNFGPVGAGPKLVPGMVIAIEPMLNLGTKKVILDKDGFTYRTADGLPSAHFEHTVLITESGAKVLTQI